MLSHIYKLFCALFIIYSFKEKLAICKSFSECYSTHVSYTLQLDAFFNGKLALVDNPYHFLHDWAWGQNGMYQLWGLGVPILRFPFEFLSRSFFELKYFPDIFILLTYAFLTIYLCIHTFSKLLQYFHFERFTSIMLASIISYSIFLAPPVINMLSYRIAVYEEAIFYGLLYSLFLLCLSILYLLNKNTILLFILSFFAGFAALIRPTAIIYATSIVVAISCGLLLKNQLKNQISIGLLFSIGILTTFYLNYIRFGHILEFGYSLNLSSMNFNDYSLRFKYPFLNAKFSIAALELFSAIFLIPKTANKISYDSKMLYYQSDLHRFREFTFDTFNYVYLTLFAIGLLFFIAVIVNFILVKKKDYDIYGYIGIFSITCFITLFAFYLYAPSLTSRYIIDFFVAIKFTIITLLIYITINVIKLLKSLYLKFNSSKSIYE